MKAAALLLPLVLLSLVAGLACTSQGVHPAALGGCTPEDGSPCSVVGGGGGGGSGGGHDGGAGVDAGDDASAVDAGEGDGGAVDAEGGGPPTFDL